MSRNPIPPPYKVGDRVVVVMCDALNFDDYEPGDTATVIECRQTVPGYFILRVRWDKPRFEHSGKEMARCNSLYPTEVEPI
jgi:hypothetical protein